MKIAKRIAFAAALLLVLTLLASVVLPFLGLIEANCSFTDVDIATGRVRTTRYLLWCPVFRTTEDSAITQILPPDFLARAKPRWRRALLHQPIRTISIDYVYGPGLSQIHTLPHIWEEFNFPPQVRQKTALHLLAIWEASDSPYTAEPYLGFLWGLENNPNCQQILTMLAGLDMPKVEGSGSDLTRTYFYPDGKTLLRIQGYRDADGQFIKHGSYESWYPDGKRELVDHYTHGAIDGRRFEWNTDGQLTSIEGFHQGRLTEYESPGQSRNFSAHPDFPLAQRLAQFPDTLPATTQP